MKPTDRRWCKFCGSSVDPTALKTRTIIPFGAGPGSDMKFCDDDCLELHQKDRIKSVKDESIRIIDRERRHKHNFRDGSGGEEE